MLGQIEETFKFLITQDSIIIIFIEINAILLRHIYVNLSRKRIQPMFYGHKITSGGFII